jgi:hypothetical protein
MAAAATAVVGTAAEMEDRMAAARGVAAAAAAAAGMGDVAVEAGVAE